MKTLQKVIFAGVSSILYGVGILNGILLYRILKTGEIVDSVGTTMLITSIIASIVCIALFVLACRIFVCFR